MTEKKKRDEILEEKLRKLVETKKDKLVEDKKGIKEEEEEEDLPQEKIIYSNTTNIRIKGDLSLGDGIGDPDSPQSQQRLESTVANVPSVATNVQSDQLKKETTYQEAKLAYENQESTVHRGNNDQPIPSRKEIISLDTFSPTHAGILPARQFTDEPERPEHYEPHSEGVLVSERDQSLPWQKRKDSLSDKYNF